MVAEGEYEPMRIRGYERPFPVLNPDIPVYLAAMGPLMTRLAGEIGDGWISHELCSPDYLAERVLPDLERRASTGQGRSDATTSTSSCRRAARSPRTSRVARRRVAGLVGFYATVRTYADFFDFHDLADDQQR